MLNRCLVVVRRFRLRHHDTIFIQPIEDFLMKLFLKQFGRGADRVGQVENNYIKFLSGPVDKLFTVPVDNFRPFIFKAFRQCRKMALGNLHHLTVNLAHGHLFYLGMLHNVGQRAAVTAAYNKDIVRSRMSKKRDVRYHLIIGEKVVIGHHNGTVQNKHFTEIFRVKNVDTLIF